MIESKTMLGIQYCKKCKAKQCKVSYKYRE